MVSMGLLVVYLVVRCPLILHFIRLMILLILLGTTIILNLVLAFCNDLSLHSSHIACDHMIAAFLGSFDTRIAL